MVRRIVKKILPINSTGNQGRGGCTKPSGTRKGRRK